MTPEQRKVRQEELERQLRAAERDLEMARRVFADAKHGMELAQRILEDRQRALIAALVEDKDAKSKG